MKVGAKRAHKAGEVSAATSAVQFRPPQFGSRGGFYDVRSQVPKKFNSRQARGCRMPAISVAKSEMSGTSQVARKPIEEVFGWIKTVGGLRKLRHHGSARVNGQFLVAAAAYNLVRMRTLETTA